MVRKVERLLNRVARAIVKQKAARIRARTHLPSALPFWANDEGDAQEEICSAKRKSRTRAEMLQENDRK